MLPLEHKWGLFAIKLLLAQAQFHQLKFHLFPSTQVDAALSFYGLENPCLLKTKQNTKDNCGFFRCILLQSI